MIEESREMAGPVPYALNNPIWHRDRWQATLFVDLDDTKDIPESARCVLVKGERPVAISDVVDRDLSDKVETTLKGIAAQWSRGELDWWESADTNETYCHRSDKRDPKWRIEWRFIGHEEVWGRRQLAILKDHRAKAILPPVRSGLGA